MIRTFAIATAIAAALIALSPMQTVAQVNVPPQPKVNVAPNVPNVPPPRVNRPDVAPEPDTSRVRLPDEAEEEPTQSTGTADTPEPEAPGRSAPRTAADRQDDGSASLADYAPIPPVFPETLAKAAPRPPEKPERVALIDPDGTSDDDSGNLGDAAELDEDEAPGLGDDETPIGQDAADRLRERFQAGLALELEQAEQLARLREIRELGGLEVGLGDASRDQDCGPGVSMPAGTDLPGLGCPGGGGDGPETSGGPERNDSRVGFYPLDPRSEGGNYPRPDVDSGSRRSPEHSGAWISGRGGSATGNAGIKDFNRGQAQQDEDNDAPEMAFDEEGRVTYEEFADKDGEGYTSETTFYFDDGSKVTFFNKHDNQDDAWGTPQGYTFYPPRRSGEKPRHFPAGSGGGEAEQPDPRGPGTGGGAGADCLMLGVRCDVAESETWGEKMKEWARQFGSGHDMLTPKEAMEQAGQPLPVPGRDSATGGTADPRGVAGLSPCFNAPVGCGSPYAEGAAGASEAAEPGDLGLDTSISGLTPPCVNNPGGCAGSGTAAESAAETSAGGEAAR